MPAAVGDTGIADELLLVEVIAEVLRHPLHEVEVGAFDHDPLPVLADTQKAHEAAHAAHHIPGTASTPARTASGFGKGYFGAVDGAEAGLHVGLDIGDAALPDLAVIFFEDKCQLGIRFPDTADQVLFLRKPVKAFLDDMDDLVGILQRAAGRHRHIDTETVALHLFPVLDIQGDREDQAKEQQDDGPEDRHPRIPHTGLQQH